jgi:hypothetical protein
MVNGISWKSEKEYFVDGKPVNLHVELQLIYVPTKCESLMIDFSSKQRSFY